MSETLTFESTSRSAVVDGLKVTFHEAGTGPPLVLLHGGGLGASAWSNYKHNVPAFASSFRTILPNQPGFGKSEHPPNFDRHYLTFSADIIAALLDQLEIHRVHLLGNSLGAGVAVRLALDHPDRVGRIALMGAGSALSIGLFSPRPSEGINRLEEFMAPPGPTPEKMEAFLRTLVVDQSLVTPAMVTERFAAATDPDGYEGMQAMRAGYDDPAYAQEGELWRVADQLEHDVLITWGREDRAQPLDGAFVALQRIKNARLYVIPRCGHWAHIEARAEFERVVTSFLLADDGGPRP
ncbi:MAG: hsaD 2 [Acidimicrobiales bacterium]|nr:hsaD 2 [Acidimicrobiales bacterium]